MAIRQHPTKWERDPGRHWYVDVYIDGKRQMYHVEGSYEEAVEVENTLTEKDRARAELTPSKMKIRDLIPLYLDYYRMESAPGTVKDFKSSVNLYFIPFFGAMIPAQLTVKVFNEFRAQLFDRGLSPTSINKHLNYFSGMLRWAAENGYCRPLDFKIPKYSKKHTTASLKHPLSEKEITALYKKLEPHYRVLFLLMAEHGLRMEEALTLKISDIDVGNELIKVLGKGNKIRRVPFMSDRFVLELNRIKRKRGYLVTNPVTKKPYATIWKPLQRAAKAAKIGQQINHHLLRHSFITNAAKAGMSPYALQQIAGHEDMATTLKVYTHIGADYIGEAGRMLREKNRKGKGPLRLVSAQ